MISIPPRLLLRISNLKHGFWMSIWTYFQKTALWEEFVAFFGGNKASSCCFVGTHW